MNEAALDWRWIQERRGGKPVVFKAETDSTNDDARELAREGAAHGAAVLADAQRRGRGRRGAVWVSPARRNLIASVVLRPALPPEKWARLTQACALAVCDALDAVPGLNESARIKWPNDVYLSGKKVCGILVESAVGAGGAGFVIAGAGVNLNLKPDDFPEELRDTATSVWIERGGLPVERELFALRFLDALERRALEAERDFPALLAAVEARSFLTGRRVTLLAGETTLEGVAAGLGPEGELLLRLDDGEEKRIASADFVRPLDGP